ncbi:hypothetical protein [Youngiibacter multivorans]|uniref:Multimeric flavodoxin WrbA n=1 Tax=Youngiibacter multivorans TaxID=937251 RepID=A0ABS4FZD8_9CLOT|nr:hypothetical protein [Youngiibacter multivorans]MBP1917654.1 multimeric flavodoxin WrbA [Youngiibacter multivorans]
MKIYAINGGPRKTWNTATMLDYFVKGVLSVQEDTDYRKSLSESNNIAPYPITL